jgi:hypothetical protein
MDLPLGTFLVEWTSWRTSKDEKSYYYFPRFLKIVNKRIVTTTIRSEFANQVKETTAAEYVCHEWMAILRRDLDGERRRFLEDDYNSLLLSVCEQDQPIASDGMETLLPRQEIHIDTKNLGLGRANERSFSHGQWVVFYEVIRNKNQGFNPISIPR